MAKVPVDVAKRITALRGHLGLNQTELARLLGVSNVTVNRWEHGHTTPAAVAWSRIVAAEELGLAGLTAPAGVQPSVAAVSFLPVATTSFVGRRRELAALTALLLDHRLVTIVGPGGIGKTRLAIELAAAHAPTVAASFFADLSTVASDAAIAPALAAALQQLPDDDLPPLGQVLMRWGDTHAVVVLDNCEHVLAGARRAATELLAGWPSLRIIATSRAPIGIDGEAIWTAPPLAGSGRPGGRTESEPMAAEAVQLFLARATERQSASTSRPEALGTIAEICRRLDGLPLAIELAAARMATVSPDQLLERLDRRLILLASDGNGPGRHSALEAAIAWSHDLLSSEDQVIFRRLGIFAGPFDLDAAELACQAEALPAIERLVRQSLVNLAGDAGEATGTAGPPDPPRYRMLESIRLFARDRLRRAGEEEATVATLADHLAKGPGWHARFASTTDHLSSRRVVAEIDNVQVVQAGLLAAGDKPRALAVAVATDRLWTRAGRTREGLDLAERALALPGDSPPSHLVAMLQTVAWLRFRTGDAVGATAAAGEAIAIARADGTSGPLSAALDTLGWIQITTGRPSEARRSLEEALALCRLTGEEGPTLRTLVNLGHACKWLGAFDDGIAFYEEARAISAGLGAVSREREGIILNNIGDLLGVAGRPREAIPFLEGALAVVRELGLNDMLPSRLCNLAEVYVMLGESARAIRLGEEALAASRDSDDREDTADMLYVLASAYHLTRDDPAALRRFREALAIYDRGKHMVAVAMTIEAMAATVVRMGAVETACRWLGFGEAERGRSGVAAYPVPSLDTAEARCRRRLSPETFRRCWDAGAATPATRITLEALTFQPARTDPVRRRRSGDVLGLTSRQAEVLRLVADGRTNGEIAAELAISGRTVERHLAMVFATTGTDRRAAAVATAMSRGWLDRGRSPAQDE